MRVLRKYGYQADIAANGLEAIDALRPKEYELIFMDVQMPVMDGLEATRAIKSGSFNSRPRIIAVTV